MLTGSNLQIPDDPKGGPSPTEYRAINAASNDDIPPVPDTIGNNDLIRTKRMTCTNTEKRGSVKGRNGAVTSPVFEGVIVYCPVPKPI